MVTGEVDYKSVSQLFVDNDIMQAERLEGAKVPKLKNEGSGIIIGSIEDSEIIKSLINEGKLPECENIRGKWETFIIKQVDDNLVIAGSDARGTIYGIYHLSEEIGVFPWYCFSDAPVEVREKIAVVRKFIKCFHRMPVTA